MKLNVILFSIFVKTIKQLTMKNYIFDLLDQVTPRTKEHKFFLSSILSFLTMFFAIIGALYCILKFMR